MIVTRTAALGLAAALLASCATPEVAAPPTLVAAEQVAPFDVLIQGGMIYDGSGGAPYAGDVGLIGDRIAYVGPATGRSAKQVVDARGKAVSPGFINMLSWAIEDLIEDGRGIADLKQGVTLEVFGEGNSYGPWNDAMKTVVAKRQGDIKYDVQWTSLGEYLEFLEKKGISPNVASFVGATTVRIHELGEEDVDPTPAQLDRMRALVRDAMKEGAMGVGSSLIYAPANYAETPELVAITTEAGKCGGMYISHMRSEANDLLPAIDELITISRQSGAPAEIYHFKQAGKPNWGKLDAAIAKVEQARAEGLRITADMYNYTAGATGLDAAMPVWVQAGGLEQWIENMKDPKIRARVIAEMRGEAKGWENLMALAGGPDRVLLNYFKNPALKPLTGKTLAEVAKMRGTSPQDTAIDLVIEDGSRVGAIYFLMNEANVERQTALPWMAFGSDEGAPAPEGVFLKSNNHPRAYGNVARLLGHYVRDRKATTLQSAIHRLTQFPATNLSIRDRGSLKTGFYGDVVVFDPATINAPTTYEKPHQLAVGVSEVFVNGTRVIAGGEHTGARPGRVVRGPGWTGWPGGGACKP